MKLLSMIFSATASSANELATFYPTLSFHHVDAKCSQIHILSVSFMDLYSRILLVAPTHAPVSAALYIKIHRPRSMRAGRGEQLYRHSVAVSLDHASRNGATQINLLLQLAYSRPLPSDGTVGKHLEIGLDRVTEIPVTFFTNAVIVLFRPLRCWVTKEVCEGYLVCIQLFSPLFSFIFFSFLNLPAAKGMLQRWWGDRHKFSRSH